MSVLDALRQLEIFKNTIVLDEEAFQKASTDLDDLAVKLQQLKADIEEMLNDLQQGFDTPAGHKFVDACHNTLLDPVSKQAEVLQHVARNLSTAKTSYESVFEDYRDLVNLINSD